MKPRVLATLQRHTVSGYQRLQIIDMTFGMGYTLATSLQKPSDCNIGNEPFTAHGLLYIPQNLPPKFHHRAHETPPPVPNRSQINPFHAPNSTSLRASLILSSHRHLGLKWSLSLRLPHRNSVYTSPLLSSPS